VDIRSTLAKSILTKTSGFIAEAVNEYIAILRISPGNMDCRVFGGPWSDEAPENDGASATGVKARRMLAVTPGARGS
jgi:hypothetical protein